MTRIKRGVTKHKTHKKILDQAKGMRGRNRTNYRLAKMVVVRSKVHAYRDRKLKKRVFRALWIVRLNAALRAAGMTYGRFVAVAKAKNMLIDRKNLSNIAAEYPAVFEKMLAAVK